MPVMPAPWEAEAGLGNLKPYLKNKKDWEYGPL